MAEDSGAARAEYHVQTAAYVDRLASRAGYSHESIQSAQTRVQLLRQLPAESFLEVLTVGNSKLRGEYQRWQKNFHGEAPRAVVTSGFLESPELEPPDHSEREFIQLYQQMQGELNTDNLGLWAAKLYAGVIFAHMFPDGNGRLSRNLFSWMTTGELTQENIATKRGSIILQVAEFLNKRSIETMLDAESGQRFDYRAVGGLQMAYAYQADERATINHDSEQGLTSRLKYIAARRAGIMDARAGKTPTGKVTDIAECYADGSVVAIDDQEQYHNLQTEPWTQEEQQRFQLEYQRARVEWFKNIQQIIDKNASLFEYTLTLGMTVPNPLFMGIPALTTLLQTVGAGDQQKFEELISDTRYGRADEIFTSHQTSRQGYYEALQQALVNNPNLAQSVANPPSLAPQL